MSDEKGAIQKIADSVADVEQFDPGLGAYSFANLGDAVKFADLMSRAGPMLPEHLRFKPPLCLAVTMRAAQWKFDPFALAAETYQATQGGVIGYQAKVFVAALRSAAGITLQYRYDGEATTIKQPFKSPKGRLISPVTATGNRRCTAWANIDGALLEYTTPPLDDIAIKNSPLWHSDPDQQLAYYAARAWTRRYRPDVMMGAYSDDEVEAMAQDMKDVTPKNGFAEMAEKARQEPSQIEQKDMIEVGKEAFLAGATIMDCPHDLESEDGIKWAEGWRIAHDTENEE